MIFSLAIYGAPYASQAPDTAYQFANAVIASGHKIHRIFFYMDGVQNATKLASPPQDEADIPARWSRFILDHQIDAVVCIAAALRRGVINEEEANRYDKPSSNLAEGFTLSGLGQLVEAGIESDRLVTFGY